MKSNISTNTCSREATYNWYSKSAQYEPRVDESTYELMTVAVIPNT